MAAGDVTAAVTLVDCMLMIEDGEIALDRGPVCLRWP
jgi:hypothetical protein